MKKYMREILWGMFVLYAAFLLWILFFSREVRDMPLSEYLFEYSNLLPFRTTVRYIRYLFHRRDIWSLALGLSHIGGNFLLFLPMGFFLPTLLSYRTRRGVLLRIFLMIVGAEAIQAFLRLGILDIDDVIYNFLGAVTGYGINFRFREYISIVH